VSRDVVRLVNHDVGKYSIWRLGTAIAPSVMLHHAFHIVQAVVARLHMF
jgi:hypothetical protein